MEHGTSPYFQPFSIKQEPLWDGMNIPPIEIPPTVPAKKKAGRKRKVKEEPSESNDAVTMDGKVVKVKQEKITDHLKVRKKHDRFKGMSEEEVLKRTLPDHLSYGLDIVIVGINPGLTAAFVGHHYAGPGNHFWKCLFLSELIPEQLNAYDDYKLKDFGIGFTNIVERTSRGSADLSRKEIQEGGEILKGKIQKYKPKIAVFNGKGIYEVFVGHKKFHIGKQPDHFPDCPDTAIFVMPSSSARFTQLPRAVDKVPFYQALKKYRDYLRGDLKHMNESEICFPDLDLKVKVKKEPESGIGGEGTPNVNGEQPKQKKPRARKKVKKEPEPTLGDYNMMNNCVDYQQFQARTNQGSAMNSQFGAHVPTSLPDFSKAVLQVKSEPFDPFLASFNQQVQNCPTSQPSFSSHPSSQQQHLHYLQHMQPLPQDIGHHPQGQPQGHHPQGQPQGTDHTQNLQYFGGLQQGYQSAQQQDPSSSSQNWTSFHRNGNDAQHESPQWQYHPMTQASCFFPNTQGNGNASMASGINYGMPAAPNGMPHSQAQSQSSGFFTGVKVKQEPGEGFSSSQLCGYPS